MTERRRKPAADTADLITEIREAVTDAADLLSRTDEAGFLTDRVLQRAATGILIQTGEAAHKFDDAFKDIHPEVNWRAMYAMRNLLAHHYVSADPQVLWDTLTTNLPELSEKLRLDSW